MGAPGTLASIFLGGAGDEEVSDFRPVPRSDGREAYGDRGGLDSYPTNGGRPFGDPAGVRREAGFGADEADLRRGYCEPVIREDPAYDAVNYRLRGSLPRLADEDQGNSQMLPDDYEFRRRNQRSRGFLTRPHLPTER